MFVKRLVNFLLLFFLIYDINFKFFPEFITTGRLAMICLIIMGYKEISPFLRKNKNYLAIFLIIFISSLLRTLISQDHTQTSRLFFFFFYCIFGSFLLALRFQSMKSFLSSILLVISVQAFILIYVFFNPSFKAIIELYINYGANFTTEDLYRSFGITSSSGAALSVIQGLGVGIGLYALSEGSLNKIYLLLSILICFFSAVVVGRTGVIISFFFFTIFIFRNFNLYKLFLISIFIVLIFELGGIFKQKLNTIEGFSSEFFIEWLSESITISNNKTVHTLVHQQNTPPDLTIELFFIGTGTVTDERENNTSGHDSGYIQTYFSLGFLMTVLFYRSLFLFIYKRFANENKGFLLLIIITIAILEFKEPFLFKYSEGIIIMSLLYVNKITYFSKTQSKLMKH